MSSVLVFFNGNSITFTSFKSKVLYMSFGKFLLAVESRDLSQADKSIIRLSSFSKLFLNDKIYSYIRKTWQFGKIDSLVDFIIQKIERLKSKHILLPITHLRVGRHYYHTIISLR